VSSHTPKGNGSQDFYLTVEPLDVVSGGEVSTLEFPGGVLECANAG
jgi:hypothetical protein